MAWVSLHAQLPVIFVAFQLIHLLLVPSPSPNRKEGIGIESEVECRRNIRTGRETGERWLYLSGHSLPHTIKEIKYCNRRPE